MRLEALRTRRRETVMTLFSLPPMRAFKPASTVNVARSPSKRRRFH